MRIQINNRVAYHFELIESVICRWHELVGAEAAPTATLYLNLMRPPPNDATLVPYLRRAHPSLQFGECAGGAPDATIELTAYPDDFKTDPATYALRIRTIRSRFWCLFRLAALAHATACTVRTVRTTHL